MKNPTFSAAYDAWNQGAALRERRRRFKDFTYGRQWGDVVPTPDGPMTEEAYALSLGKRPITNNLIRQMVKSVVGRFRHRLLDPETTSSRVEPIPDEIRRRNLLDELDSRLLEEFLISGCAVQRVATGRRIAGDGVWVDNISPNRFFVNRFTDPRATDIELVGCLHDMSLREVVLRFAGRLMSEEEIRRVYAADYVFDGSATAGTSVGEASESGFFNAEGADRCRVIEVWTLESRKLCQCLDTATGRVYTVEPSSRLEEINRRRASLDRPAIEIREKNTARWHCTYFTPDGQTLLEGDSPFPHGLHPFVVKFYPMTDSEVHPFVEDIIDQQRYVNRLVTLVDHIMSHSAKGVLLYPVESFTKEVGWDAIRRQWSRPDGIIPYNGREGTKPEQVNPSGTNAGASELLALEMKLMEQVSGVSGALSGQLPSSITSSSTYQSSIENASIALLDIFETFQTFRDSRNRIINTF